MGNRCRNARFALIAILAFIGYAKSYAQACNLSFPNRPYNYTGDFVLVQSSGPACEAVFKDLKYKVTFNLTGSESDRGLLTFQSDHEDAFLRNVTFVGVVNFRCDFSSDKTVQNADRTKTYFINEAVVSRQTIFSKVTVQILRGTQVLCTAAAEYTGRTSKFVE